MMDARRPRLSLFCTVSLVMLLCVSSLDRASAETATVKLAPGNAEDGKLIFDDRCASCHGLLGRGDGPRAPFLSPRPSSLLSAGISAKSDAELFSIITNGKPRTDMPAWKDLLTEQQRQDVLAYLRTLVRFHKPLTPPPP
jgi:mono/diheme cytochrome c family protein